LPSVGWNDLPALDGAPGLRSQRFGLCRRPARWASASLGVPTHLKSRRPVAVDRQVHEEPVDWLHRSDRPLGQMGDDHRGELVDLAVKGQLAPAEDDHDQHVDLVVAVRLDAIAPAEPDEVGLQVLPVEPPPRPWMVPPRREAGQVDWRDGVRHAAIFPPPHTMHGATGEIALAIANTLRNQGLDPRALEPDGSTPSTATTRWCRAAPCTPGTG
jgi:hypothetical protein